MGAEVVELRQSNRSTPVEVVGVTLARALSNSDQISVVAVVVVEEAGVVVELRLWPLWLPYSVERLARIPVWEGPTFAVVVAEAVEEVGAAEVAAAHVELVLFASPNPVALLQMKNGLPA